MKSIKLNGILSTVSVMEWIYENDCPKLENQFFEFPEDGLKRSIIVSSKDDLLWLLKDDLDEMPLIMDKFKRMSVNSGDCWIAKIKDKYYYMSI